MLRATQGSSLGTRGHLPLSPNEYPAMRDLANMHTGRPKRDGQTPYHGVPHARIIKGSLAQQLLEFGSIML